MHYADYIDACQIERERRVLYDLVVRVTVLDHPLTVASILLDLLPITRDTSQNFDLRFCSHMSLMTLTVIYMA